MTSKNLSSMARLCLLPGLMALWLIFRASATIVSDDIPVHVVGFYALTLVTFTAYPARRRTDLVALLLLSAIGIHIASEFASRSGNVLDLLGDATGILALHVSSHLEALRKRMREDPWLDAFAPPAADRRRSGAMLNMQAVKPSRRT